MATQSLRCLPQRDGSLSPPHESRLNSNCVEPQGVAEVSRKRRPKKDLHDPDNHDGVITDLEPDILESEVKWA